jgi:hypothetical protein
VQQADLLVVRMELACSLSCGYTLAASEMAANERLNTIQIVCKININLSVETVKLFSQSFAVFSFSAEYVRGKHVI